MNIRKLASSFYLFWIVIILSNHPVEAAQLHAILVADTIGGEHEFETDLDYMQREVKRIAALTNLQLNALCFEGYQVRIDNILHQLSQLKVKPDDVVFLYFNLHGSRTREKESQWPDFNFSVDLALFGEKKGYLDFDIVNDIIKNKHPRLLVSLAESCNSYRNSEDGNDEDDEENQQEQSVVSIPSSSYRPVVLNQDEIDMIKGMTDEEAINFYSRLFLDPKGSIIISSSIPGEPAIKFPLIGGIYTIGFLRALHHLALDELSHEGPSWPLLLELASSMTKEELSLRDQHATSQYEINLD